jgi:hypothetical protein
MKEWSTLWRFRKPLEWFGVGKKEDEEYIKQVEGAFKNVFNTAEGEIILKFLISHYGLDAQVGDKDNLAYITAQQDVVRFILSMTN